MKLKFGDIISFFFDEDTCWGPYGDHTGIVLYDDDGNLRLYHLDERVVKHQKCNSLRPASYDLENFERNFVDEISIIGNIAKIYYETR